MAEYLIHENNFDRFEKKAKRIMNKCAKLGLPFIYEVIGDEYVETESFGKKSSQRFIKVNVEGRAFIADYEAVAVAECMGSGNIVKKIGDNDIEIPERFHNTGCVCEHCNKNAIRKEVIIIRNVNTGEFKQVGKACCKLYTGNLDAQNVAMMYEFFEDLQTEQNEGLMYGGGERYFHVEDIIRIAAALDEKIGYIPSSNEGITTKGIIQALVNGSLPMLAANLKTAKLDDKVTVEDLLEAWEDKDGKYKDIVSEVMEHYESLEENGDFIRNLHIIFKEGYVTVKDIGYLGYLPTGYKAFKFKKAEREKREALKKNVEYFGEVGKRYKDIPVSEIKNIASYETMYGVTSVYKILLDSGETLTWKTTSGLQSAWESYIQKTVKSFIDKKYGKDADYYYKSWCEDESYTIDKITFTVKEHSEYRNEKQTLVSRCAFSFKPSKAFEIKVKVIQSGKEKIEEVIKFVV